jgi:hypothetical protein
MDADLSRVRKLQDAKAFAAVLERIIADTLTSDFWSITLPNQLETSSTRSPALFAYYAAQNKLGAPVLFSDKQIADLLDPSLKLKKKAIDTHHLFPRHWLETHGVEDLKLINQIANFALLEWPDNIDISDDPPASYVPKMRKRFSGLAWKEMCQLHALPDAWETLEYGSFLRERRVLMAEIIRRGFEELSRLDQAAETA